MCCAGCLHVRSPPPSPMPSWPSEVVTRTTTADQAVVKPTKAVGGAEITNTAVEISCTAVAKSAAPDFATIATAASNTPQKNLRSLYNLVKKKVCIPFGNFPFTTTTTSTFSSSITLFCFSFFHPGPLFFNAHLFGQKLYFVFYFNHQITMEIVESIFTSLIYIWD